MFKSTLRRRMMTTTFMGGMAIAAFGAVSVATLAMPTAAHAQAQTGSLRIAITGEGASPVSGAVVSVSSPDSLVTKTGTTGADGRVRISGLDPATNYTVTVAAPGYSEFSASSVAVVTGQDRSVNYALVSTSGDTTRVADIVVTGRSLAAVDVTSAQVSTTLNLATLESLPTGRSYQSYLQLVPGVKPSSGGNPSSRSGVNYSDVNGAIGSSSDNLYYLDGVDVTDPVTGTFGSNFNSEIIQEQQVIVGGVSAEYAGGSGLISRVVTKSGSNEWHGSLNYYMQNDGLVAEDKHSTSGGFSTYDTAFTLGGPIIKDKLWIFGSYQKLYREDDVLDTTTGDVMRTVERETENTFAKLTWQVTDNDRLTLTYFGDPADISGSNSAATLNNRVVAQEQGGDNYKIDYSKTWGDLNLNAYYFVHEGMLAGTGVDQGIRDNVVFATAANSTLAQRSLGGAGNNYVENRDRKEFGINGEYYIDTNFGSHTIKAGYTNTKNEYAQSDDVPGGMTYTSLASQYAGTTYAQYIAANTWTARAVSSSDNARIIDALENNATALAVLDANSDGQISSAELNALTFNNTSGNPYGNVNVYRAVRAENGPIMVSTEGQALYLQDTWTYNQLTVTAGLRAEKWEHFASDGSKTASFDWDIAPRLSVVYDVFGDGRSKVFGFAGRYYDPVRANMADFAGTLTGPVTHEQINVNGEWVTFRVRGGAQMPDAIFAPTTKTPYTDEFMIGGSTTFGSSIGLSVSLTKRVTKDILEDYDLALYSDPNGDTSDGHADANSSLYLPLSYFGYDSWPVSNYVIATLAGGKREYTGLEVTLTKFKTDNWQGQLSYTWNDAKGNTNSDSNADYQGDWLAIDPRAPNMWGPQAGNIEHQFKAYGSYDFDFGLQVSGVFNWNSGSLYTPADVVSSRYLPPMSAPYEWGGVTDTWVLPGFVGSEKNPSYYTFDARLKYVKDLSIGKAEFFLDIFNVFDKQSTTGVVANRAGSGQYNFQDANSWVAPRRAYLGVRYSF